jgi:hypothetical protein
MFDINGSLLFDRGGEQYWRAHDNVMTQSDAARDAHQRYRPGAVGATRRRGARYLTFAWRISPLVVLALVTVSPQPAVAQNDLHNQPYAFGVPTQPAPPLMQTTPPAVPDTPQPGFPGAEQTPTPYLPSPGLAQPAPVTPSMPSPGPPPPQPRAKNDPTPQSAPLSIQQYLVSVWHGMVTDNFGNWDIYVAFKSDGEFVQNKTLNGGQFRMTIVGRYNARLSPDGGMLTMFPQHWQPAQYCISIGDCRQIPMQPTVEVAFQPINHDMFSTQFGTFQRVNAAQ